MLRLAFVPHWLPETDDGRRACGRVVTDDLRPSSCKSNPPTGRLLNSVRDSPAGTAGWWAWQIVTDCSSNWSRAGSVPDCQRSWREYYGQPACIIECHPNAIPRAAERRAADGCPVGPSVLQATPGMQPWRIKMGMQPGIKSFAAKFGIAVDRFELSGRYFALVASLAPQAPSGNIFCPSCKA